MRSTRTPLGTVLAVLPLAVFGIYVLLPVYWLLVNATKSTPDLFSTFGFWFSDDPQFWQNVRDVFSQDDGIFARWMVNTVWYAAASAFLSTLLALMAGYAFAKWRFVGRDALFWVVLAAIMIPGAALAVPTYQLVSELGLINTSWAVILPSIVSPFALYMLRVYIDGAVPDELIDAGRMDGAGEMRILRSVVLRIVTPGVATVALVAFVGSWNNYLLPLLVLSDPELYPVTLGLTSWNRQSLFPSIGSEVLYNAVVTGSLLSILPLTIAFVFMQRYVRSGLTLGAVK
ncbi:binding-protein-dependent transport systems inner membrane component [Beutenbergia cavernae DSM 12333]|uniref:Binding-protein-dependent transport systems inner membrane component n=1 Tax=Beutenbergia cavernae (strain ATCC BAA-8 / DSM 12333 / CCUG 43141 / JCM 11478 / NBRC 16432 / NCIMB 13614 / HKI 0122) TaxID=471853 RepID=C5C2M8_BEUC1|nr:carbohydrate ABC transporter permease [Beutenbergia cavernae]ACQ79714.1 binding-protein-dependent transport systems inner membrane component [Beutenbergia cavernae DSM 12333]